jgi:hypothetical protein
LVFVSAGFLFILTPTLSKGEGVRIGLFYISKWYYYCIDIHLFQNRAQFFSILRGALACKLLERFIEIAKVVEAAFETNFGNAYGFFRQ